MKKFTKSMLTLALLVLAVGGAKAQTETDIKSLQAANGTTEDWVASIPATYPIDVKDVTVFGSDANSQVTNANVNKYDYIYFEVTNFTTAHGVRIFFWDPSSNSRKDWYIRPVEGKDDVNDWSQGANVTGNGTYCVKIPTGARLQGAKTPWTASPTETAYFQFNKIYVIEPSDPLAGLKDVLQQAIDKAGSVNSFAKTAASWQALQDAKQAGETELANPGDETSLTNATTAINDAIAGLKLEEGYVNLTKAMFHEWTGIEDEATIKGAGGCDLVLGTIGNGGILYGNSSVLWNQYAKLINAKALILLGSPDGITFGARTDRLEVGNGSEDPNGGSLTTLDLTITEGKASVDLSSKASVRINAIKNGWGGPATVTDLLVEFKPRAVTVGAAGYATFSTDLNTKVAGTKAYAAKVNGSSVALTEVSEIPAGAAVIIETEGNYEFPVINEAAAIADNDLLVSDGSVTGNGSTIYVLAKKGEKVGFYLLKNGENVPAGKAYLNVSASGREFIGFAEDVTAIKSVETVKANGAIYNLAGQQVKKAQKGLYIINGKKVIK